MKRFCGVVLAALVAGCATNDSKVALPEGPVIDAHVRRAMAATRAKGLAVAVVDAGQVVHVSSHGLRNGSGDPLTTSTVMYGASITKAVFSYMVMQLVDDGLLDLDTPIERYLPRPLPHYAEPEVEELYARWSDLHGDERWRRLTPRILLTNSSGFANFGFLEPDGRLKFHFEPGTRYAYSGDGYILLQFVLERGLGLDVGREMQARVFDPLEMRRTSLIWRDDFASDLADGWTLEARLVAHDQRSAVRAAGSMDTTIEDMARFAAAYVRGDRLSPTSRGELTRAQLPITSRSQFPTLQPELPGTERRSDLQAGLGVVVFKGPQGPGFVRGGHNDSTGNTWVCLERSRRCVVLLSNDVRAEAAFPALVRSVLGETGTPWSWIYPDVTFWGG